MIAKPISVGRVLGYNPWNQDAEPGDIMVDSVSGRAYRLYSRKGRKADAGELSMREIKRPGFRAQTKRVCLGGKLSLELEWKSVEGNKKVGND